METLERKTTPGTFTFTYGRESVTLDVTLPRDEFDRRSAAMKELQGRAWAALRASKTSTPK